jgi:hypothetical protein
VALWPGGETRPTSFSPPTPRRPWAACAGEGLQPLAFPLYQRRARLLLLFGVVHNNGIIASACRRVNRLRRRLSDLYVAALSTSCRDAACASAETATVNASVLCEAIPDLGIGDCFGKSARSDRAEVSGHCTRPASRGAGSQREASGQRQQDPSREPVEGYADGSWPAQHDKAPASPGSTLSQTFSTPGRGAACGKAALKLSSRARVTLRMSSSDRRKAARRA